MSDDGRIRVERTGRRLTIVLDRPSRMNAMGGTMRDDLAEAFEDGAGAWERGEIRVIVLRGEGEAFCAGGDVANLLRLHDAGETDGLRALLEKGERVVRAIRAFPGPVIASIDGPAVGAGLTLALACDLRICSNRSKLGMAFSRIGLHPDWGGTFLLTRTVGEARALELCLSARIVLGPEAVQVGLVHESIPDADHAAHVDKAATRLERGAPRTQALIKDSVYSIRELGFTGGFDREATAQLAAFATEDAAAGFRAFLEKRRPDFQGR
jgi:2-(1,2-epoxy-1,2-dihydrophenyl)acetyl-CoA isomerase